MNDFRCLTLWQPWASVTAIGVKPVENRGQQFTYRGPVGIHAGSHIDVDALGLEHVRQAFSGNSLRVDPLAKGLVLAVARLVDVHRARIVTGSTVCCAPWGQPSQWHLEWADVRHLPEPVPAVGRQSLWRPDPDTARAVLEQMEV